MGFSPWMDEDVVLYITRTGPNTVRIGMVSRICQWKVTYVHTIADSPNCTGRCGGAARIRDLGDGMLN